MNQDNTAGDQPRRFRSFIAGFVVLILVVFSFSDSGKRIVNADDEAKSLASSGERSVVDSGVGSARSLGNTTVTFQDGVSGYTGTRDTYIYNVSPATVRGAENLIIQDRNPSNVPEDERTSLLRFDLSSIPINSTILSAQLDFYVDSEGQGFGMYRMQIPWNEATASFASIGSRHFVPDGVEAEIARSENWPGVDGYVGPITVSVSPATISDWVNGVMVNNGWLMVSAHADDGVQLRSSEHATIANRPKLTVVYNETPPNFAPAQPVVVSPLHGATDVSTSPNLEVSVADPNADGLTVTYYGRAPSTVVPGADFTIVAMPDTQHYVDNGGANAAQFAAQTQWIVDNKDALNIKFVSGLGDIVENGNALDSEWLIASNAYATIEDPITTNLLDGIPYGLVVGNHDQTPIGGGNSASTAKFNQYFGISRFTGRAYYGGHYGSDNDNNFELFSGGGHNYIALHLEFDPVPLPAVVAWADNLLQTYSDRRAIVSTHHAVGIGFPAAFSSQATTIYNTLRNRPNFFLFLGGHVHGEGRRQDTFQGRTVWSILSDYQARPNGGNGLLRIMTFSPANNTISVKTYSPTLGQFETDYDSQFTISYDMSGSAPFAVIGTNTGVPSGTNTLLNWPGLAAGTEYEWYATVSDGTLTTTGPVWSFTTTATTPSPTNSSTNTPSPTPTCIPVSIPNVQSFSGVPVTVPVNIGDVTGSGVISLDMQITYDPVVLSPGSPAVTQGPVASGTSMTVNGATPGTLIISLFGPMTGSGVLVNLHFNVVGAPGTSSALNLAIPDGTPCFTTTNGSVTVIPGSIAGTVTYGNAIGAPNPRFVSNVLLSGAGSVPVSALTGSTDGDYLLSGFGTGSYTVTPSKATELNTTITSFDAALIARHTLSIITLNATQQTVADVSGTGGISSFDAALVARHAVASASPAGSSGTWTFTPVNSTYSSVNSNITGEDYSAFLMGEVSGNWTDTGARTVDSKNVDETDKPIIVNAPHLVTPAGKEVVIPVSVQGLVEKGIIAYEFDLRFDPSVMQPQENPVDVAGTVSRGLFALSNLVEPGLLLVVVYGPMPIDENGVLLNLKFTTVGAFGAVSPLTFERIIFNEGDLQVVLTEGLVEIL
ncbi:MAG: cohesin domain-containing protein [Pyrinomonadaceae bacterium]